MILASRHLLSGGFQLLGVVVCVTVSGCLGASAPPIQSEPAAAATPLATATVEEDATDIVERPFHVRIWNEDRLLHSSWPLEYNVFRSDINQPDIPPLMLGAASDFPALLESLYPLWRAVPAGLHTTIVTHEYLPDPAPFEIVEIPRIVAIPKTGLLPLTEAVAAFGGHRTPGSYYFGGSVPLEILEWSEEGAVYEFRLEANTTFSVVKTRNLHVEAIEDSESQEIQFVLQNRQGFFDAYGCEAVPGSPYLQGHYRILEESEAAWIAARYPDILQYQLQNELLTIEATFWT